MSSEETLLQAQRIIEETRQQIKASPRHPEGPGNPLRVGVPGATVPRDNGASYFVTDGRIAVEEERLERRLSSSGDGAAIRDGQVSPDAGSPSVEPA